MSETAEPPRCDWCPPHAAHTSLCGALEVDQFGSFTGRDCDCEARAGAASTEATPLHEETLEQAYTEGWNAAIEAGATKENPDGSTEATERPDLRAAFDLMSSEWEEYVNGLPTLPEESHDIPWPIRNFVRRARAVLTGASTEAITCVWIEPSRHRPGCQLPDQLHAACPTGAAPEEEGAP